MPLPSKRPRQAKNVPSLRLPIIVSASSALDMWSAYLPNPLMVFEYSFEKLVVNLAARASVQAGRTIEEDLCRVSACF